MAMDSNPSIPLLTYLTQKITFYCPIIIIIIGTIGCFCNFITFSSVKLRKCSCSLYFFGAAIFDFLTIDFGLLTRLLSDHFGYILYNQSQVYCKIRLYLVNIFPAIATCFIVLAAMDRFMSTSSKLTYHSFATIKYAKWIISFCLIICILSYIHYIIFSDLRPTCSLQSGAYGIFTVVYSIVWTSLIPHILMLYFGFGTQWHIRMTRRRVVPSNGQHRRMQRTEIQLVKMMLFQVGISSLLILTRIAYYSYNVITSGAEKSDYQKALDTFFSQLTTQLFYLNYAKSFYVYTLSSKYFRRIFTERTLKIYYRLCPGRMNAVRRRQRTLNGRTNNCLPMVRIQRSIRDPSLR